MGAAPFFIADDYTGAADVAAVLWNAGADPTVIFAAASPEVPALNGQNCEIGGWHVCALAIRSVPPDEARRRVRDIASIELRRPIYFKFDSTLAGNIGPVIETLLDVTGAELTVAVPAWPSNGRTQEHGQLFVRGIPLSESHMRHHPVTPIGESNVVRLLQLQMTRRVALIDIDVVKRGVPFVRDELRRHVRNGIAVAAVDAVEDDDLETITEAVADLPLICGASGLVSKLAPMWARGARERGTELSAHQTQLHADAGARQHDPRRQAVLVIAGSCSPVTLAQVAHAAAAGVPIIPVSPTAIRSAAPEIERLAGETGAALADAGAAIVAASSDADTRETQGRALPDLRDVDIPRALERILAEIARRAAIIVPLAGIVATGGDTARPVIDAFGIRAAKVDGVLDNGVACLSPLRAAPAFVLKPGNFGTPDLLVRAIDYFKYRSTGG